MASPDRHTALRSLLLILTVLAVVAGLTLLVASGLVASFAPPELHLAPPGFVVILLKVIGALLLAAAYVSYAASKDPARYVAFIDALAFLLIAAAAIDLYALGALHVAPFYPASFVIARSVIRVTIALVLIWLRPRGAG